MIGIRVVRCLERRLIAHQYRTTPQQELLAAREEDEDVAWLQAELQRSSEEQARSLIGALLRGTAPLGSTLRLAAMQFGMEPLAPLQPLVANGV